MNAFKEKCVELRKANYSLIEISKITGRPKTSVYFHIKNIPLNQEKLDLVKSQRIARIVPFSGARKGKSVRGFIKFEWNKETVNVIAHFMFDGSIYPTGCSYNNRSQVLIEKVRQQMKKIYEFDPKTYLNTQTGVIKIAYFNVAMASYIKLKSVELINNIFTLPKNFKREFLSAFFDDEGCIDFREKRNMRRVRGYQKDTHILFIVKKLLQDLGIDSHIALPNEVVVAGKENLKKFQKEINFSPGIYINGNRSNSIWKKSLEKRVILDQAIKSFKL